jgi:hypothetical protein
MHSGGTWRAPTLSLLQVPDIAFTIVRSLFGCCRTRGGKFLEPGGWPFVASTQSRCGSSPEPVDALFVDIILNQEMQAGIELAKRAVELKPGLRVVYSTGLTVTDHVRALLGPGAVILEKPYTVDQLLTSLLEPPIRD